MKLDCILFDLDGTLINTNELIIQSFQHTLRVHQGRECSRDEFVQYFGEPLLTTLERFAPGKGEDLIETYRTFNHAKHDELTTHFPGTIETLTYLKDKGITLGVVTSKLKSIALRGLRLCNIEQLFEVVVALEDTTKHKPEPDPLLKALQLLGRGPAGVIYVGDAAVDILCAKNAGVLSAAVMWSACEKEKLLGAGPDIILNRVEDLRDLV